MNTPPMEAISPLRLMARYLIFLALIPTDSAARSFSPTMRMRRPSLVR